MALLENHLEQIALCARNISELPFPQPKMFTNALLHTRDITTLIRDTEPHERALFSVDPNTVSRPSRRRTTRRFDDPKSSMTQNIYAATDPRKQSLVARVLGGETMKELERARSRRGQGSVDVEILLKGAERLCDAYPLPGVPEKITALRNQYEQALKGVQYHEGKVQEQVTQLDVMNNDYAYGLGRDDEDKGAEESVEEIEVTEEMLRAEQEEIREIEEKKRMLEERVHGMQKDLGGLLR